MRSAVILAGGTSSRLGADKQLLEFGGRPLICWTVEKLKNAVDEVIVVARDKDHASYLETLVFEAFCTWDRIPGLGPVAGLAAGMKHANGSLVFAAACDLPFINLDVIDKLFDLVKGYEAAVPMRPDGMMEPLHAVYHRKRMLLACEKALAKGELRIKAPLRELRVNFVSVEVMRPIDPKLITFFNLNTPDDLEMARRIWLKYSV